MKKYSEKEVIGLFKSFKEFSSLTDDYEVFLKEKGLIKRGLKEGKWYKYKLFNGDFYYVCLTNSRCGSWYFYGIIDGKWGESSISKHDIDRFIKMSDKEVEEVLIKEARKRGFKEGVMVECLAAYVIETINEKYTDIEFETINGNFYMYNTVIFQKGKWATIIEEKEEAKKEIVLDGVTYIEK